MHISETLLVQHDPAPGGYRRLVLEAGVVADSAMPGQFVHLRIPGLPASALRRPFSICRAEEGRLTILYKVVGWGTDVLSGVPVGTRINVLGPLGKGFPVEVPEGTVPMLVGGGYGVAPLLFLASRMPKRGRLFVGGRTASDILLVDEFRALGWDVHVATEDGSLGMKGRVTVAMDAVLASEKEKAEWFACGPDGLLRVLGTMAQERGERAWLSLDKHMACGVGACLACIQALRAADGTRWIGRVCKDGPVFESREIIWEG